MNKPAAKEPSMDEILSSIRQIIADEDNGDMVQSAPQSTAEEAVQAEDDHDAPMALSPEQMVTDAGPIEDFAEEPDAPMPTAAESDPSTDDDMGADVDVGTDDVAFEPAEKPLTDEADSLANMLADAQADTAEEQEETPQIVLADDISFDDEGDAPQPEPVSAQAAPMPDPNLSRDMAEKLLEPTTAAASKHAFNRLNQLSMGSGDVTIENMVREMLRPMLKEWLDENLPGVVEKLVEREIERISRGS